MNTVSQVLKKSGHDIYENMIPVIILSIFWFVLISPALFFLAAPIAILYLVFTAVPGLVGVIYAMDSKINRKPFRYSSFLRGFGKYYGRALVYSIVMTIFSFILVAAWWYAVHYSTIFGYIAAIFQTYFFIFVNLALLFTLPILVKKNMKITLCMKESIILFLRKSLFTIGTYVQIVTVSVLLLITVVSIPLLFAGMLSVFILNTHVSLSDEDKSDRSYNLSHTLSS